MKFLIEKLDTRLTSFEIFQLIAREPFAFFLDSSLQATPNGRYSFIGYDPFDVVCADGPEALNNLKQRFSSFIYSSDERRFPLLAGAVGYITYDYGLYHEKIAPGSKKDIDIPDCVFGFYDRIIVIDHAVNETYIVSSGLPENDEHRRENRAKQRLEETKKRIEKISPQVSRTDGLDNLILQSTFTESQYIQAVGQALDYIARGDIYQINLSQRFEACTEQPIDAENLYRALRALSPTNFSSYFNGGNFQILSSSPERFLSLKGRLVQTRPMKGTRPRGKDNNEDEVLRREILLSEKERAELLMITDLERNDLGRVCEYGSISVKELRTVEEYKNVFQATSTIEGILHERFDCFDLIRACFPGGSITGCPKIRAMEIIDVIEPVRRSIYTGALGYIDFCGDMDLNILIRTMLATKDKIYFQVGSGIVADSVPKLEYEETLVKAEAMMACLKQVLKTPAAVSA